MFNFLLIVLLSFMTLINDIKGQSSCDRISAQEECMTRGCDCWLTSKVVFYQEWLEACIDKLCSYSDICSEYGCTFEECIEGNCDLSIDYTSVCELYCNDNCGLTTNNYNFINLNDNKKEVLSDLLPILSEINSYLIIEFDFKVISSVGSSVDVGRHGGFFFGSGDDRENHKTREVASVDWIDRLSQYGFRFSGLTSADGVITSQNGFTFDYNTINKNPNGHWKIRIEKSDLSAEFRFNDILIYNGFTVRYPSVQPVNLGFWVWSENHIQFSNIKVTYDSV